jgi:sRNA-binding carbon storage regulator CsrA
VPVFRKEVYLSIQEERRGSTAGGREGRAPLDEVTEERGS